MTKEIIEHFPISPTRMKAYDCLNFFKQQYLVEKTDEEKEDNALTPLPLLEGKFGHRVIELYNKALLAQKLPSDSEIFNTIFAEVWSQNLYIPESRYEDIKEPLMNFAENHTIDVDYMWGAEVEVSLNWLLERVDWNAVDVWLRAKLDRVDIIPELATGIITDYKTGFYIPPESQLKKSLQTKIYTWILWVLNPYLEKFQMFYHFTRWNKKVGPIEMTVEDLKPVEQQIRSFTERLTNRINDPQAEWPALIGENCPICRYECPLIAKGIVPLKTIEQAISAGMQIQALKKKIGDILKDLTRYSKATDSKIDVGTGIYGYFLGETWRGVKADKLVSYCLDKGIDLNLLLKIDTKKIKELEEGEIKDEIKKMFKVIPSTKFRFEEKGQAEESDAEKEA